MQCEKNGVTRVTFFNVNGDGNWAKWTLKFLYAVNNSSSAPAELIARSIAVIKLIARNIAVIWMQWRMQHSVLQGIMTNPPQNFIEIDFWKPPAPPPLKKYTPPFLLTPLLNIQILQAHPFWPTLKSSHWYRIWSPSIWWIVNVGLFSWGSDAQLDFLCKLDFFDLIFDRNYFF